MTPSLRAVGPSAEGPKSPLPLSCGRLSLFVAAYFLMIALPIQFNLGATYMTGVRVVLLVTTIPLGWHLFSGQLGRVILTDVLLLVYVLWCMATLFVNSPSQAVSFGGGNILEVFGSYVLARSFVRTPEQFRAMCRGLFAVLIFSLPFAIYETQTGRAPIPIFIAKLPGVFSWGDYYNFLSGRRLGLERAQVIFSHPIHYGLFCASLISLAMVGFRGVIGTARRYLLGGMVCAGVICSVSSGAILPMILQFILMIWALIFNRVRSRWIILSALVIFCYVFVDLLSNRTAMEVFLEYGTMSPETAYARKHIFEWGMANVRKNPFLGIGMNEWERPWWKSASMDNFWLLCTVRYGIPGFIVLVMAYLAVVWKAMRRDVGESGPVWQFRRAWVFTQLGMIVTLSTVDVWANALSYVFFLFGTGVWIVTAQPAAVPEAPSAQIPTLRVSGQSYTRFGQVMERKPKVPPSRVTRSRKL